MNWTTMDRESENCDEGVTFVLVQKQSVWLWNCDEGEEEEWWSSKIQICYC